MKLGTQTNSTNFHQIWLQFCQQDVVALVRATSGRITGTSKNRFELLKLGSVFIFSKYYTTLKEYQCRYIVCGIYIHTHVFEIVTILPIAKSFE